MRTARSARLCAGALVVCGAMGCGHSLRLGVGPSVDTAGRAGFEVRLSGAIGPGNDDGAVVAGGYAGVGLLGDRGEDATLAYGATLGVTGIAPDHFGGNAALVIGGRSTVGATSADRGAVGLELGVGYALHDDLRCSDAVPLLVPANCTRSAVSIGLTARGEYLWGQDERGLFTFPIYVELYDGS